MAAVPLTLVLFVALVVTVALTPGKFGFHDWPTSSAAPPRENAVVLETPVNTGGQTHDVALHTAAKRQNAVAVRRVPARAQTGRHSAPASLVAVRTPSRPVKHDVRRGGATRDQQQSSGAPAKSPGVPEAVASAPIRPTPAAVPNTEARPATPAQPTAPAAPTTPVVEDPPAEQQPVENHGRGHGHHLPWWLLGGSQNGHRDADSDRDDTNSP
jgi:hypothetical protein